MVLIFLTGLWNNSRWTWPTFLAFAPFVSRTSTTRSRTASTASALPSVQVKQLKTSTLGTYWDLTMTSKEYNKMFILVGTKIKITQTKWWKSFTLKLSWKSKGVFIPKKNVLAHFEEGLQKHEEFCSQLRIAAEDYKNEKTLGHQVRLAIILRLKKLFESIRLLNIYKY